MSQHYREIASSRITSPRLSRHAIWRASQRSISKSQIQVVVRYGRRYFAARGVHCFFGRREAATWRDILGRRVGALVGVVVVLSTDGTVRTVLTTYRNRKAWRDIKRMPPHG